MLDRDREMHKKKNSRWETEEVCEAWWRSSGWDLDDSIVLVHIYLLLVGFYSWSPTERVTAENSVLTLCALDESVVLTDITVSRNPVATIAGRGSSSNSPLCRTTISESAVSYERSRAQLGIRLTCST